MYTHKLPVPEDEELAQLSEPSNSKPMSLDKIKGTIGNGIAKRMTRILPSGKLLGTA